MHTSQLTPGETDPTACNARKTTTYIVHSVVHHFTYALQTQGSCRTETKRRMEDKGKKNKENKAEENNNEKGNETK